MPYGAPVVVPSARLDLTKYALKNLKRFAQVGAGDGNPNNFLKAYKDSLLTDLADRNGPPFNRNVYQSLDDGATWNIFHTVGINSMPNNLTFQWNGAGSNLNIILAHGTTSGNSGIDLFTATGPAWTTQLNTGVVSVLDVQTSDPKNFGMNADGTTFNATLIAVGVAGGIWRSTDGGATWNARASGTGISLTCVVSNGAGVWIAVGANILCRSTDDGLTWVASVPAIFPSQGTFNSLTFGLGRFAGIRNNAGTGEILSSVDGLTWEVNFSLANRGVFCISYDQNGIILVGFDRSTIVLTRNFVSGFNQFVLANLPELNALGFATGTIIRTLSFDGSYQSNMLSSNRWLLSMTNGTADNPLFGAQNLISDTA